MSDFAKFVVSRVLLACMVIFIGLFIGAMGRVAANCSNLGVVFVPVSWPPFACVQPTKP